MKILMLGWELPPHNSGGLGVACYQLCKTLTEKGDVSIEFVLPYTAEHDIEFMKITHAQPQDAKVILQSAGVYDSYKYIAPSGEVTYLDIFQQQKLYEQAIDKLVLEGEYNVIHAHDWLTFRAGLRAKMRLNVPLILHVHSIESDRAGGSRGNPLVHEIEEVSMLMADHIVAVSQFTKDAIVREYNIPAEKIEVIHNSIDRSAIAPLDEHNAYPYLMAMKQKGYRVVTNIGRLTVQKGLPNLLYAAKTVIDRAPKTIFLIVGSGEQFYELIELAAGLGISKNVVFTGFQRGQNWRDAFAIADLFVMPSVSEPFGLTPLEAIGYGTPALISRQSGISEVITNCLKVDFWDVDEMANQITAVMQNDNLRDELHKNSLQEFEKMSWHASCDKLMNLYSRHAPHAAGATA